MRNQNKKKRQDTGFTLIELLAVITIMGILMMVAIPSISNTIKNSRKDTFKSTAAEIQSAVKNLVNSDSVVCGTDKTNLASASDGDYYVVFKSGDSDNTNYIVGLNEILDGGATSSFGGKNLSGYVHVNVASGKFTYAMKMADESKNGFDGEELNASKLTRANIATTNSTNPEPPTSAKKCVLTSN